MDTVRKEDASVFALSRIFMYEPRLSKAVVEQLGSASAVFQLDKDALFEVFGPYSKYRDEISSTDLRKEEDRLESILKEGYRYMAYDNDAFPQLLWECEDSPLGLFVRSEDTLENVFRPEKIAFVGTRDASPYGLEWCEKMVQSLGDSDVRPTIVSGLAYGIDISAHKAAMEASLPTIAVLGTGINVIYPRQHEMYAKSILDHPASAIISEYPPDVDVIAVNFLSRNRIIAGLSRATVLVESRLKGGGMSTARDAASYNREVFALPGRNEDLRSQGCNMLIHAHIADAVISCDEMFKSLGYKKKRTTEANQRKECRDYYNGSMDAHRIDWTSRILLAIRTERGITPEQIALKLGLPLKEVLPLVGRLEADGFIVVDLLQRCRIAA